MRQRAVLAWFPVCGTQLGLVPSVANEDVGGVPQECALRAWRIALRGRV